MSESTTPTTMTMPEADPSRPHAYDHPFRILIGPLIGAFIGLYSEAALNIALPSLMGVFDIQATIVQWMTTGYILAVGIVLPLFGLLVKWIPTRGLAFTAIALFVVGATVSALAPSFAVLLAGRVIQGVATGIMLPLIFNTAVAVYPPSRIGTAMGAIGMVVMFAPAVSPVIAGLILEHANWRWIFWSMVPVMLVSLAISVRWLRDVRDLTRPRIDSPSIALSTIGFGGVVFGLSIGGDTGWASPEGPLALVVGLLAVAAFAHRQLHHDHPILDVRAFRHPSFTLGTTVILVTNALLMCAIFLLPMYLQDAKRTTVLIAGLLMLPGGLVNGILSAVSGRISDAVHPKILIRLGLVVSIAASVLLATLDAGSALAWVVIAHCLLMVGIPLTMTPAQTLGLQALPEDLSSDGSTIISTLQQIGGAAGTALGASLLAAGAASVESGGAAAVATGTRWGFVFCVACAVAALVVALFIRGGRRALPLD